MNYDAWLNERLNDRSLTREQYMVYWHEYQARQQMHGRNMSDAEMLQRANVARNTAHEGELGKHRLVSLNPEKTI